MWLVGDSGYPQKPYLMTPILDAAVGSPEYLYTHRHIRTRVCIERCIGLLKTRFRCLSSDRKLRYAPDMAGKIINVCCILHNICIKGNAPLLVAEQLNGNVEDDPREIHHQNNQNLGFEARRQLILRYFTR